MSTQCIEQYEFAHKNFTFRPVPNVLHMFESEGYFIEASYRCIFEDVSNNLKDYIMKWNKMY